ncbi:portal protein [Paraburkholderia tropica]|uniref:portal protein n=1 Tax=Paraburkholderia tropica TaxID=92647 RepID=UPI003D2A9787
MDNDQLMQQLAQSMMPDTSPAATPQPGVPVQVVSVAGDDSDPVEMSDTEISAILESHISQSQNWLGTGIAKEQEKAMRYYLGVPEGDLAPPDIEGRSSVVDTVVSDQIEWLMPSLMEIFFGSSQPVKFCPRKPGDEQGAEQTTHVCNHVVRDQNPGFEVFLDWFKTALLSKIGVAKAWWELETTTRREEYSGLTDVQLAIVTNDPNVSITKCTSYVDPAAERMAIDQFNQQQAAVSQWNMAQQRAQAMGQPWPPMQPPMQGVPPPGSPNAGPAGAPPQPRPMQPPPAPQPIDISKLPQLHDVVLTISKKEGHVAIEALNPEDFLVAESSRRIGDGFSAHRMKLSISDLRAKGYKNVDDLSSDPSAEQAELSGLAQARQSLEDQFASLVEDDGNGDESQRKIWVFECYLPIDCDGDGISEWRKITKAGSVILDNEVVDGPPFAVLCPIRIPGLLHGRSIADLAMPIQKLKTGILRGLQDNMNLQINGRDWVIEKDVNMSDYLNSAPGRPVRVKNPNSIGALQKGLGDSAGAFNLLQYVDSMSQERTGVTKYSQGLDSDTLNHTATGIENITQRADLRVKLIARTFAETGVKDLFWLIQKLLSNYQDKNMVFQLNGQWVDVDPRVWRNQYVMSVTVGTGTGDTGKRVAQLTNLLGVQMQAAQNPDPMIKSTVTAQNIYKTQTELVHALQLGDPSQFFSQPHPPAPQPPAPDPNQAIIQGQVTIETTKAKLEQETDAAKIAQQERSDVRNAQLKASLETQHEQLLDARERDQATQNLAWEREQFYANLAVNREKAAFAGKVTDPAVERSMNDSIQSDIHSEEQAAIDREYQIAQQLMR